MEDKNRELNPEELAQGAGGLTGREIVEQAKQQMRQAKRSGRTKTEWIGGQEWRRALADRYWDEV